MNLLWDFRLFSFGYSKRGVGEYTLSLAKAFLDQNISENVFILGDKNCIPRLSCFKNVCWIQYKNCNWKRALIDIPLIIRRYRVDIYHYWIALGPLRHIGLGLFNPCKSVGTIYDMGTEQWDVPFLRSVKKSWYWKTQKKLIQSIDKIICISEATSTEVIKTIPSLIDKIEVIYKPITNNPVVMSEVKREKYFIILGGSPHKNVARVVKAFDLFCKKVPVFKLVILGQINKKEEELECISESVLFEQSMERYRYHLMHSSGLIFCSIYEGLGIPPLEAMSHGCPLLVSNIPSMNEICNGAAVFTDPLDIERIADGMFQLLIENEFWSSQSRIGASDYKLKTIDSVKKLGEVYHKLHPVL